MIPYHIIPSFQIGFFYINMYGVMFALGVLVAILLAGKEADRKSIQKEVIYDLVLYLLIGILIGARLFYVFFYWPKDVTLTFLDVFKVWQGGLAFFGGLVGAIIAGFIYVKKKRLDFWVFADIFAVPLVTGHIFGRLGDYLTGGHPGKVTDVPWAIYMDNALRHPVVLYEIIGLVIIVIILLNLKKFKLFDGFLFLSYLILYSVQRMFLDLFRLESTDPRFFSLTPSQIMAIFLLVITGYLSYRKLTNKKAQLPVE